MKKHLILLLCITCFCAQKQVCAQSSLQANATYNAFVGKLSQGNKSDLYNSLYNGYQSNLALLKGSTSNSADYKLAQDNLMRMWQYLENAAIFYSSQGSQSNAMAMAEAYVGMPLMDEFRGFDFDYSENHSRLTYFVASRYFNMHEYAKAIPFLDLYLRIGDESNRKNVMLCLIKACKEDNQIRIGLNTLDLATNSYPSDYSILSSAINFCQDAKEYDELQKYLDKAKAIRPQDEAVLNIQGKLYEDTRNYAGAEAVYRQLLKIKPNSLEITKHIALNCYNQGVYYSNKSFTETDAKEKKNLTKSAHKHFNDALPLLVSVTQANPNSVKYNMALATAYAQLGQTDNLDNANKKLASMGAGRVSADIIPQMMTFSGNNLQSEIAQNSTPVPTVTVNNKPDGEVPSFSAFAKEMIEKEIKQWQEKDPYETASEYQARVTEQTRKAKISELKKVAENEYTKAYAGKLSPSDFSLKPYDAENEVFLIESAFGKIVVHVPRGNNEAKLFERNWNGMSFKNPQYCIVNDSLAIAALTFVTPTGNNYQYTNTSALSYTETQVDVHFDAIDYSELAKNTNNTPNNIKINKQTVSTGQSDVDRNIPEGGKGSDKTFVLIIANEDYKAVAKVPYTTNDGNTFAEYCKKTLGLPASNVHVVTNATFIEMRRQVKWLTDVLKAYNGEARGILYYAGHGIPDEATKSAYILPVDGDGTDTSTGLSLAKLYDDLGNVPSQGITVLLDACFSGATREGGMLASARGITVPVKAPDPVGNVVILSAATGDETAWPYKEMGHGLFTYFLLKKLQETQGKATLGEIADYVTQEVTRKSLAVNSKRQTPTVSAPSRIKDEWKNWKLK